MPKPIPRFIPNKLLVTEGALKALGNQDILTGITRHARGDWGEMDYFDRLVNERALIDGRRIISIFRAENGTEFYVITEADRSSTKVLLPEEWGYSLTEEASLVLGESQHVLPEPELTAQPS